MLFEKIILFMQLLMIYLVYGKYIPLREYAITEM
jgi:hypothetical protein